MASLAVLACTGSADPSLLGAGTFARGTWRVVAEMRGEQICIRTIVTPGDGEGLSCVSDEELTPVTTHGSVGGTDQPRILHGLTLPQVASVAVELGTGAVQVPTVVVPAITSARNSRRGFAVAVDEFAVLMAVTALDAEGRVLQRYETGL